MTVQELTYNMVFDWKKKTFDNFNKSMGNVVSSFTKLSGIVLAGQGVAFGMAKNIADINDQLTKQAQRLNLSTEQFQRLGFVAQDNGANISDLTSSLQNLSKAQEDVLLGKGDLQAFGQLGINPQDFNNTNDLLLAISDSISQIDSDSKKISLLERVGISRNLLQSLEKGSDEVKRLGDEFDRLGGRVTEDQKKTASEFQANWLRATTRTKGIYNRFSTALTKSTNKFLEKFNSMSKEQMEAFEKRLEEVISVIGKIYDVVLSVINKIIDLFSRLSNVMGGVKNLVLSLGGAFLLIKRQMIRSLAVPIALLGALYLAIDDVLSALEGKDSYFKDLVPQEAIDGIGKFVAILGDYKVELGLIAGVFVLFGSKATLVAGAIMLIYKAFKKLKELWGGLKDSFFDKISSIGDSIKNIWDSFSGKKITGGLAGMDQIKQIQKTSTLDQKGTIRSNNNANFNVTINGATTNAVDELNTYLQNASNTIFGAN